MKQTLTLLLLPLVCSLFAQGTTIDFEDASLPQDSFRMGLQTGNEPLVFEDTEFPTFYNDEFGFWESGWALSNRTDTIDGTFTNLYSAFPTSGADGSDNFLVGQQGAGFVLNPELTVVSNCFSTQVANTTYAYRVMEEGNDFAKKFGGADGTDPDFFLLTAYLYFGNELQDSVSVPLADFRFEDDSQDYILRGYETMGFASAALAFDSIEFRMSGSDVGDFGINTPLFFVLDNLEYGTCIIDTYDPTLLETIRVFPNPASEFVQIELGEQSPSVRLTLFNATGQQVRFAQPTGRVHQLDVANLAPGAYTLLVQHGSRYASEKIIVR